MSGKKFFLLVGTIFVVEILVLIMAGGFGPNASRDSEPWFTLGPVQFEKYGFQLVMEESDEHWILDGSPEGHPTFWVLDVKSTRMILLIDVFLLGVAIITRRSLRKVPGRLQGAIEVVFELFQSITRETLGRHANRHLPTVITLFFFIWISNLLGVIPLLAEPTRDINVVFGQMLVMIIIVHYESIRVKGIKAYIREYFEPLFILAPLNIVGEIAKGVSLSFRLFGNIFGGSVIILVISYLFKYTIMPVALNLFFGIFVGTVQAFVFTMLSLTYIAVAIAEES